MAQIYATIVLAVDNEEPKILENEKFGEELLEKHGGNKYISLMSIANGRPDSFNFVDVTIKCGDENLHYQTPGTVDIEDLLSIGNPIVIWIRTMKSLDEKMFESYYCTVQDIMRMEEAVKENMSIRFQPFARKNMQRLNALRQKQSQAFAEERERRE